MRAEGRKFKHASKLWESMKGQMRINKLPEVEGQDNKLLRVNREMVWSM